MLIKRPFKEKIGLIKRSDQLNDKQKLQVLYALRWRLMKEKRDPLFLCHLYQWDTHEFSLALGLGRLTHQFPELAEEIEKQGKKFYEGYVIGCQQLEFKGISLDVYTLTKERLHSNVLRYNHEKVKLIDRVIYRIKKNL